MINSVIPAVSRASSALVSSADVADNRLSTRLEIIHATGEDTATQSEVWVKNTGAVRIIAVEQTDVFFGPETDFVRITFGGEIGDPPCTAPCWQYELENDTVWNPTATMHITVFLDTALAAGTTYFVKVVAPNGVEDSKFFTL